MTTRIEKDSMGEIEVPANAYWGAQTERSRQHFAIGQDLMPLPVVYALAELKQAAAKVNSRAGKLSPDKASVIDEVCLEILAGRHDKEFPLPVWQTGSGTHSNMNVNEVITNRGNELAAAKLIHPNDDVNMGQSSNDIFPSACHVAAARSLHGGLLPAMKALEAVFEALAVEYKDLVKIGRTHLQDATPLTLGQEISAWAKMLSQNRRQIEAALPDLQILAIGGTAVGTGVNTFRGFGDLVAEELSNQGLEFTASDNAFHALTSRDALLFAHGAVNALAANLLKIANDIRMLGMGPRAGLSELILPANEPGSSIMPGKVNPTQCEQLSMVCVEVMGNQTTISIAASQGNFQLNVYTPVIIHNFLRSAELLTDSLHMFTHYCASGLKANQAKIQANLEQSLMLVTALSPKLGYEAAAKIAKLAFVENLTLKEAVLRETKFTAEEADDLLDPRHMLSPE